MDVKHLGTSPTIDSRRRAATLETAWNAGGLAWSDRTYTWTDLGHMTSTNFDYKLKTSVTYRTSTYEVTPPSRYQVVVTSDGPSPPSLSASSTATSSGWQTCDASWRTLGGSPWSQSTGGYMK